MLLQDLFEVKKKPKAELIRKKLRVKSKRRRRHVRRVTDENMIANMASKAATWAAGKVLAKLSTGGA